MGEIDLDALEAVEKAATEAPWIEDGPPHNVIIWRDTHVAEDRVAFMTSDGYGAENAAFIVALRNAAPALIAAARKGLACTGHPDMNTATHHAAIAGFNEKAALREVDRLNGLLAKAEEAMEPFAKRAAFLGVTPYDVTHWHPAVGSPVSAGDLRFLASVLDEIRKAKP